MYKCYQGPDYSNPNHQAYFEKLLKEVKKGMPKKPIWKKYKFWFPLLTGVVTAGAFAVKFLLDIDVPDEVIGWIIAGGLTLLSAILGVDWSEHSEE